VRDGMPQRLVLITGCSSLVWICSNKACILYEHLRAQSKLKTLQSRYSTTTDYSASMVPGETALLRRSCVGRLRTIHHAAYQHRHLSIYLFHARNNTSLAAQPSSPTSA
jgi:hypothetical protein